MYGETSTEYCDTVKLAAQGDPVQTITTLFRMAMKKNPRIEYEVIRVLRDDGVCDYGSVKVWESRGTT